MEKGKDIHSIRAVFPEQRAAVSPGELKPEIVQSTRLFHESVPGYQPTPLCCLPKLAARLGVKNIYVKDESFRFGLNAFKALGATWAIAGILCEKLGCRLSEIDFSYFKQPLIKEKIRDMVFVTATDGNHGRGLAWAAEQLGCRSVVYMPEGSVDIRVENIRKLGAKVLVTDKNYDDTVRMAASSALENGWNLVQDTAWEGYEKIPAWIVQGYTTMAAEVLDQLADNGLQNPTHLFLQAGVGSMAASVLGYYVNVLEEDCPKTFIVEPDQADCMYRSAVADDNRPRCVRGDLNTMMAGLACGEPNPFAWKILRDFSAGFVSCQDETSAIGMQQLARPWGDDLPIISGESGAVGVGLLCQLMTDSRFAGIKENMNLNHESIVLCFSTEGNTDPQNYDAVVNR